MTHPSEARVREFFEAFSRRDIATASTMFSDEVVFHVPGRNRFAGVIRGREAWVASLLKYAEAEQAGVSLAFQVHDVVGGDDHTVALLSVQAEYSGKRIEWQRVALYHFTDGKAQEVWIHDVDQYVVDEFLSEAIR